MNTEKIKGIISEITKHLGVEVSDIEVKEDEAGTVFSIRAAKGHLLTDRGAYGLSALNHIVKQILEQQGEETTPFSIDVNDFQKQKNEELVNRARVYAQRAISFGIDVPLDPMNAYERMIIHNALAREKNVETTSDGFGRNRHVVIRPQK